MIKRTGIVLLAVIVIALFSGCTEMSAEQIAQNMKEKQESIKDFSATIVVTSSYGGKTETVKAKIMNKMPGMNHLEYLEPAELAGRMVVNDGKTLWTYDPEKKEATKMEMPEIEKPSERDYTQSVKELLNQTDISFLGTDNIEGRNVYLVKAAPRNGSMLMGMHFSMWVDSENWMPLKMETYDKNDKLLTSVEYKDIKFNTGIPDSEFVFELPEGAKVVSRQPFERPRQMTLEEAREEVNFTILSPSYLPEGYVLESATVFKNDNKETVSLAYKKDSEMFMISEKPKDDTNPQPDMGEVETVSVNGAEGKLISMFGESKILIWSNDELEFSLTGKLSKEELIKMVGSMK